MWPDCLTEIQKLNHAHVTCPDTLVYPVCSLLAIGPASHLYFSVGLVNSAALQNSWFIHKSAVSVGRGYTDVSV